MPRPRSPHVQAARDKLLARLNDGFHRPGDRFLSAREVAARYGVSYQTADRLISELEALGRLERRESSGTFVAGRPAALTGVELWFHPRARRPGSYGAHLLMLVRGALVAAGIRPTVRWAEGKVRPSSTRYPVLWEAPEVLDVLMGRRRYALLLNDRPDAGLTASLVDAVATDDFSAGVCAAQVLEARVAACDPRATATPHARSSSRRRRLPRFSIVAGPPHDERSRRRVAGFLSREPRARIVAAGGWYVEDAMRIAPLVAAAQPDGVFCVNDRLAEALLTHYRANGTPPPAIVGHDNAPVAESLHLTTIETPWDEMTDAAMSIIRARLAGHSGPARHILLAQRPVYRLTA